MGRRRNKTQEFSSEGSSAATELGPAQRLGNNTGDPMMDTFYTVPETDLSRLLEYYHFGEILPGRSNASRSVFSIKLPDPQEPEAEFTYNYFMPDERRTISNDNLSATLFDPLTFSTSDTRSFSTSTLEAKSE